MIDDAKFKKYLKNGLITLVIIGALYVFFAYVFKLFIPFFISWFIAFTLRPLVVPLSKGMRLPEKFSAALTLLPAKEPARFAHWMGCRAMRQV